MKHLLSLMLASFVWHTSFAQTTQEEYLYMTNGIKVMEQSGLDMKRGYRFSGGLQLEINRYTFHFRDLIREQDGSLAGTSLKLYSPLANKWFYFCIPSGTSDTAESGRLLSQQMAAVSSTDAMEHATIAALVEWMRRKNCK